jgi:hypothetical protein
MFNSKKTLTAISKRSDEIFNIFTKTKEECISLNAEIMEITNQKRQEAQVLLDEVKGLEAVVTKNANLASKIDAFINS